LHCTKIDLQVTFDKNLADITGNSSDLNTLNNVEKQRRFMSLR